ncbi:oxaloacetate decarboxylase subunit alpha, partial [Escherichia coli]
HTIEAFVAQGKAMADMGVDSIATKDMAGLLTPYATGHLVKALKDALPLDVVVHSHDTPGVASMCQLKAVENGADRIDTAISSMAWGTSH